MNKIVNARIDSTRFGREDHGILTFNIFVDLASGGTCGIGGFALDEYDKENDRRVCSAKGLEVMARILDVVGVYNWEDLPGTYVRVVDEGWGNFITKIGNLMKDEWVDIREMFSEE